MKKIREKYGEEAVEKSNKKFANMTEEQYKKYKDLNDELNAKLAEATAIGDPSSALAQEVCDLHRRWLINAWPDGYYDKEKHYNLRERYVQDHRFKAYYAKIAPGAA